MPEVRRYGQSTEISKSLSQAGNPREAIHHSIEQEYSTVSESTQTTKKKVQKPTLNQFCALVKLDLGFRIRYRRTVDYLDRRDESARYERSGVIEPHSKMLGTFKALRDRGWVKVVSGAASSGLYGLSDDGRSAMQMMIDESSSFADFAAFLREEYGME